MARRSIQVEVTGTQQLTELHRQLRQQEDGKKRVKELRKALTKAARPLVPVIRSNIKSMPSQGESRRRGRRPLRTRLSRSLTTQIKFRGRGAGVFVYMNPRKMPDGQKGLPGYFEMLPGKSVLRHKVFGNEEVWVNQYVPPRGYFTRALDGVERQVTRDVQRVIENVASEFED